MLFGRGDDDVQMTLPDYRLFQHNPLTHFCFPSADCTTGRISVKLGERGASKGALPGIFLLVYPHLFPLFFTY